METKLVTICKELLHNKYPRDDTLIEKLVSSLVEASHQDMLQVFAEHVVCLHLMASTTEDINNMQPDSLAAFIRIIGVTAVKNFKTLNKSDAVICFINCGLKCPIKLQEKSVTHAMLCMFKVICYNELGLNFHKDGVYLCFIKSCLEDSSLFVAKLAAEVFGLMLMWDLKLSEGSQPSVDSDAENITLLNSNYQDNTKEGLKDKVYLHIFTSYIENLKNLDNSAVKIVSAVIMYFTEHSDNTTVLQYLVQKNRILDSLIEVLPTVEIQQLHEILEIIKRFHKLSLIDVSQRKMMVNLTTDLLKSQRKVTAVHMAKWILQTFNDDEDIKEIEENILAVLKISFHQKERSGHIHLKMMLCCIRSLPNLEAKRPEVLQFLCSDLMKFDEDSQGNPKILLASLDAATSILSAPNCQCSLVDLTNSMKVVCSVLSKTGVRYQVISKALSCLLEILTQLKPLLKECEEEVETLELEFNKMKMFLPEKLMNLKWEIRDSALEFLGNLATLTQDFPLLLLWLKRENLSIHIWQDIDDGESYVRATAICALAKWLQESGTKEMMLSILSPVDIFSKISNIIKNDTEAFPRRAAIDLFKKLYTDVMIQFDSEALLKIMTTSIHDLDWEVKMGVLNFWEEFISQHQQNENDLPEYAEELQSCMKRKIHRDTENPGNILKKLKGYGFAEVLYIGLNDCDKSVNEKACVLLKQLKTLSNSSSSGKESKKAKFNTENQEKSVVTSVSVITKKSLTEFVEKFPDVLQDINLDEVIENVVNPTDCYDNLDSLLDDIQIAMGLAIVDVANQDDENNAAAIDCY